MTYGREKGYENATPVSQSSTFNIFHNFRTGRRINVHDLFHFKSPYNLTQTIIHLTILKN